MKTSETQARLASALVKALSEMTGAAKDSKNPHFKNSYASLESVIDAARPVLAAHGLAFMQGLGEYVNGAMTVSTRIIHESGEWIESDFQMPVGKPDPQGTASASTYARRYSLMSILGLPAVDDDGEAAMPRNQPQAAVAPAQGPRTPAPGTISIQPEGEDWYGAEGAGVLSAAQAKKDGWGDALDKWLGLIPLIPSLNDLRDWCNENGEDIKRLPKGWRIMLREAVDARRAEL
jgi:hypothetical protein